MFHDKIEWMMILQHGLPTQIKVCDENKITLMPTCRPSRVVPYTTIASTRSVIIRRKEHKRPHPKYRT